MWAQAWQMLQPVITAIGAIALSAGAITGFAWWIFRTYSAKWLDNRFAKELEEYKHQHQRELQRLRLEIDSLLDRTVKLHGREFETLPEAWSLLNDAFSQSVTASLAILHYADLDRMYEPELTEFLEKEDLPVYKKEEIKGAIHKNKIYAEALQWKGLNSANWKRGQFHDYILKNGIFFPDPIRIQFMEINRIMISALVERETYMSHGIGSKFKEAQKLHGEGRALVEKLQGEIHARLDGPMLRITIGGPSAGDRENDAIER